MRDPFGLFQETISVSYAHILLEITHEYDIDYQTVLQDTGLVFSEMKQNDAKMSAHQWSKLVVNALQLTDNHRLGIEYGQKLRPTSHGALGFAFLSCADVETTWSHAHGAGVPLPGRVCRRQRWLPGCPDPGQGAY